MHFNINFMNWIKWSKNWMQVRINMLLIPGSVAGGILHNCPNLRQFSSTGLSVIPAQWPPGPGRGGVMSASSVLHRGFQLYIHPGLKSCKTKQPKQWTAKKGLNITLNSTPKSCLHLRSFFPSKIMWNMRTGAVAFTTGQSPIQHWIFIQHNGNWINKHLLAHSWTRRRQSSCFTWFNLKLSWLLK